MRKKEESSQDENVNGLKKSIENIIGSNTKLRRKKKTEQDIRKELFIETINNIEKLYQRGVAIEKIYGINFINYDEPFFEIIDNFILYTFGKEIAELIYFYLYDRVNEDGTINALMDQNKNEIVLKDANDLWLLIQVIIAKGKVNEA